MKKLLAILGTITIAGSGMAGLVGNVPAPTNNNINYKQINNLESLNRVKRARAANYSPDEYNREAANGCYPDIDNSFNWTELGLSILTGAGLGAAKSTLPQVNAHPLLSLKIGKFHKPSISGAVKGGFAAGLADIGSQSIQPLKNKLSSCGTGYTKKN
ncbi:hypothetical protein [Spiroplasma endosymbiont of Eupeodes luniger]|uniref:hypothetical protein n=1 Tax=Spiroplasma endosymbiont of Eupeodes luniger TaxID=3066300 RepID=UPI0030CDD57C